jgi:hypothetical protein
VNGQYFDHLPGSGDRNAARLPRSRFFHIFSAAILIVDLICATVTKNVQDFFIRLK